MHQQQAHAHHYVPQWYQRRFLKQGQTQFFYLDLHPETVQRPGGSYQRTALRRLGPVNCFYLDDLYTLRFGGATTDVMERRFFGAIDRVGELSVPEFAKLARINDSVIEASRRFIDYMGAQRFRTPRGLDDIRARPEFYKEPDKNTVLKTLQGVSQSYTVMWAEGVWEIVRARQSPTKFIVTDDPVTLYCKSVFTSEWKYPNDVSVRQIGTRTLYPLGLDSCLIITHLQLARNPWSTPTEPRENARFGGQTDKHLMHIQFDRELEEDEVVRINYILKKRATRYIAAAEEKWLYPERDPSVTSWLNLDDDWFLLPHLWKVPFSVGTFVGHKDGSVWAADEYGRNPGQPKYKDKKQRDQEWVITQEAKKEWAKKRLGKSRAHRDKFGGGDLGDVSLDAFLRKEGLLL